MNRADNRQNRTLSVAEYFIQVQKEYLIAQFRSKIYYNPKDKRYWRKVMQYKAEKINSIAARNNLNSILNSNEKLEELKEGLFDLSGRPKFSMNAEDKKNYYSVGNEFSYEREIYVLESVEEDGTLKLFSRDRQTFVSVQANKACRIL